MATKLTYSEQLKHPNWQRKRLEVMQRDEFTCQLCRDKETQLHVHHKRYVKGRMAWEYEADDLVTLCWPCHESMHSQTEELQAIAAKLNVDGPQSLGEAIGILAGWAHEYSGYDMEEYRSSFGTVNFALGEIAGAIQYYEGSERLAVALRRVPMVERVAQLDALLDRLNEIAEARGPIGLEWFEPGAAPASADDANTDGTEPS